MPTTTSISRESCRGEVRPSLICLTRGHPVPHTGTPGVPISELNRVPGAGADGGRPVRGRYSIPRWWEHDPAAAEQVAGWRGAPIEDLLCRGCLARRTRLTAEGAYV